MPFEILDIGLGRPISLELPAMYDKVVRRRRGGYCYELNGLLAWLLAGLGYRVTLLSARALDDDGAPGPEFDHLALRVDLEEPWLVDVGFGDAFREPLRLVAGIEQTDSLGKVFRLDRDGDDWTLVQVGPPESTPRYYRFTLVPRRLDEFEPMNRFQQTKAPYFTEHRLCTIATHDGRATLYDEYLIVHEGGQRTERLVDEREVPELLRDVFGVVLHVGGETAAADD